MQDRPGKAFLVRDARPQCRRSTMQNGGGGPLRNFLFGDDGSGVRRTTGRVSVSSEAEAEKLLLTQTLGFQTVVKVEILFKIPAIRISND